AKPKQKNSLPPTTLLMWRHCFADAKRREFINLMELNFVFSRCGSRWIKFANLTSNLSVKR
ncbi:hypothetical protein, partial [Campylobacter showae]|uniref:hypothetical protein n=1 Tax=Campylobacter showae TaxID=204 RepID=UPI003C701317